MNTNVIFIIFGTATMLILSLFRSQMYELSLWKAIVFPIMLAICGVTGTVILGFIETGEWNRISFYGSVFLIPLLLPIVALVLRVPYRRTLDYSVPQICIMLATMKIKCWLAECCGGRVVTIEGMDLEFVFPSQIIEMINALFIMIFVLSLEYRGNLKGRLYGVFFLLYGVTRFVLNFGRGGLTPFIWFIPAGHFWSIISMLIGIIWLSADLQKRDEVSNV